MRELRGVFAPIVTPFRLTDGEVDLPWIRRHIQYLHARGCTQDSFQISGIAAPNKDVYIGHWMKFNPEMLSQMLTRRSGFSSCWA